MGAPFKTLTSALRDEYQKLFDSATVNSDIVGALGKLVARMVLLKPRYEYITWHLQNNVPWYWIAAIHNMESGLSTERHLHNGDPLTAKTVQVPAGRPALGEPPYLFEDSAVDALQMKHLDVWNDWTIPGMLYKMEQYNGWGYRLYHNMVNSPYLWAGTNQYTKGKYVADGKWDPGAVSRQIGCVAVIKHLQSTGLITL